MAVFDRLTEYLDSLRENCGVPYFERWRITQRTGVWTAIAKRVTNGAISPNTVYDFYPAAKSFLRAAGSWDFLRISADPSGDQESFIFMPFFRYSLGVKSVNFLNICVKCEKLLYPSSKAIIVIGSEEFFSKSFAAVILHSVI